MGDGGIDLHSLEPDEQGLVADELRILVPLAQLVAPVDAAAEDEDDGRVEEAEIEPGAAVDGCGAAVAEVAEDIVRESDDEEDEDDDLEDETGHGDVDARLAGALADGGEGAAGALEDEANEVGGDEDPVEPLGVEARKIWSEGVDARECMLAVLGRFRGYAQA